MARNSKRHSKTRASFRFSFSPMRVLFVRLGRELLPSRPRSPGCHFCSPPPPARPADRLSSHETPPPSRGDHFSTSFSWLVARRKRFYTARGSNVEPRKTLPPHPGTGRFDRASLLVAGNHPRKPRPVNNLVRAPLGWQRSGETSFRAFLCCLSSFPSSCFLCCSRVLLSVSVFSSSRVPLSFSLPFSSRVSMSLSSVDDIFLTFLLAKSCLRFRSLLLVCRSRLFEVLLCSSLAVFKFLVPLTRWILRRFFSRFTFRGCFGFRLLVLAVGLVVPTDS